MQTVLILGISGACRREELVHMMVNNIEDKDSVLIIKIRDSKNNSQRVFTVSDTEYINIIRKYISLRPSNVSSNRFFFRYGKGKCVNQHVGINKIAEIPSLIAKYLGKESFKDYTGHCFRRTSATILADAGADITSIKRHGGWKSTSVAESYVEDSLENKIHVSNKISGCTASTSKNDSNFAHNEQYDFTVEQSNKCNRKNILSGVNVGNNCSNCTINFYYNDKN